MWLLNCCQDLLAGLPDPSLPFIPSLILGVFFSSVFILLLYKKHTKQPLKFILMEAFRSVTCLIPNHEHNSILCSSPNCVRCRKYNELKSQIIMEWERIDKANLRSQRLADAVNNVSHTESSNDNNKNNLDEKKGKSRRPLLQKPTIFYMDLAPNKIWTDFSVYETEKSLLKLNFKVIQKEFKKAFAAFESGNTLGWKNNNIIKGHWCIYPFIDQGKLISVNCKNCPNTSMLLQSLPAIMKDCVFGNACFSILYPDSQLEPHHGPTNLRLRCHIGLRTPAGCWLEVAGKKYTWSVGEPLVFDDSFEHSATFSSVPSAQQSTPRAILMLDLWHPDVTEEEKKVLLKLLRP